jgi:ABC-type oligopeptide transport system substrate-binding subunit
MGSTMRKARTFLAASLIAMTCLLASCSSSGVADSRTQGVPDGVQLDALSESPAVVAYDDGSLDVVTLGSGSCPPRATGIEVNDDQIVVTFEPSTNDVCTADISPTTHSFSADKVGWEIPDKALIVFTDFDEPVEVDVIRG